MVGFFKGDIVYLICSWRDSLSLLLPKNFKLFALVTLKSTVETYRIQFRYWWLWLAPMGLFVVSDLYLEGRMSDFLSETGDFPTKLDFVRGTVSLAARLWLLLLCCLATRASVGQKNLAYFISYLKSFGLLLVFFFCFKELSFFFLFFAPTNLVVRYLTMGWVSGFSPLFTFYLLFFLDSDGSVGELWRAFARAFKMFLYNLPLSFVLSVVFSIILSFSFVPNMLVMKSEGIMRECLGLFIVTLLVNVWANIYIKKLHEKPELYFNQPK